MYYINTKHPVSSYTGGMPYWKIYRVLSEQQNLLIAGTTGSGKSTVLQGVLYTICNLQSACDAELWLADPKRVDLIEWLDRRVPHLARYANTTEEISKMITDLVQVMEQRFRQMEQQRIKQYDGKTIYLVIDELADLTINNKSVVGQLTRLLQLARAAGIRVIMATQQPKREVLPAMIQSNITASLALRCKSAIESRQVLNVKGAELLPKHGTGILLTPDYSLVKVEIPMQSGEDIDRLVEMAIAETKY